MKFKIITSQGVICDKEVSSATLPGTLGEFTVLQNHAPILTSLRKGTIYIVTGEQTETIEVETGVAEVKQNNIQVILG
ncbi:F-type H+-transporting ATPase subunit epsilon [Parabacteroides sp. PF5-5]|uniref:ATP synthase F1 subunit epsilon n=1 Tax=unclassified Parabacteroides TaxID=2649774 RepID=UPI0024757A53|nr:MULTISPECIES: ATP synthase F1 subunit epsilon [unclassified Parabacteroides]MDH6304755.1 F-type H+-transporting ATPase subunit epsilon [Parabacteroides sp. PH5-39]MDH6315630.1 F-type H+-transporting ATPase subunit epsilon [Parabacteroides sp. PF5-13]MDH6319291.1 F-type H+-transporting ATPase subunit epsilon [Parabacteroides sp. PH5-13]MDH6323022.1 F-type H+-transporting ATPase subunit epsilon [Parabacteroides sp. PH5-8]MDH6326823.1 F-type H+-transporting ATPase subunit epsilon [Parabacteroi